MNEREEKKANQSEKTPTRCIVHGRIVWGECGWRRERWFPFYAFRSVYMHDAYTRNQMQKVECTYAL